MKRDLPIQPHHVYAGGRKKVSLSSLYFFYGIKICHNTVQNEMRSCIKKICHPYAPPPTSISSATEDGKPNGGLPRWVTIEWWCYTATTSFGGFCAMKWPSTSTKLVCLCRSAKFQYFGTKFQKLTMFKKITSLSPLRTLQLSQCYCNNVKGGLGQFLNLNGVIIPSFCK